MKREMSLVSKQQFDDVVNSFEVSEADTCKRLDIFITENLTGISRSFSQKLIAEGRVTVNGELKGKKFLLWENDIVEVRLDSLDEEKSTDPADIPLDIIYEDKSIVVVNKAKGMVVHPGAGKEQDTLVNALLYRYGRENLSSVNEDELRPGIVHRLDKDTSGVLVVAKTNEAHRFISSQILERTVYKEYVAVVRGNIKEDKFTLDFPIKRNKASRKKMCVDMKEGRKAVTHVEVLEHFEKYTYIKLQLETGRTHQIRVHLSHIGKPIAGDQLYGPKRQTNREQAIIGQCLHSKKLGFIHPDTRKWVEFDTDLPKYFTEFLKGC